MLDAQLPERTRAHYIEALSRNFVERFFLLQGHTLERPASDYGYDLVVTTYDYGEQTRFESGQVEGGLIYLQLKATDNIKVVGKREPKIAFRIKRRHARLWRFAAFPVYLIVYWTENNCAYWLDVQEYLNAPTFRMPPVSHEQVTVHLPMRNLLDEEAVALLRRRKNERDQFVSTRISEFYGRR